MSEEVKTPNNWPNPGRPGVPLFPERDGWHVMEGISAGQTALTHWNGMEWGGGDQVRALNTSPEWYRYVGPILTPAQIAEMLAAERERCAKVCEDQKPSEDSACMSTYLNSRWHTASLCAANIRNLGDAP